MPGIRFAATAVVCGVLCSSIASHSQVPRGPSTPEEREKILATIHAWQSDPLGPGAKDQFGTVLKWFADVPDLTVHVCMVLDKLPKGDRKDSSTIFGAEFMGQAAYVLEHPDKKDDQLPEYQAGVESALRTYEQLVRANEKDRQGYLDDLLKKRDAGALADFVKERAGSCNK